MILETPRWCAYPWPAPSSGRHDRAARDPVNKTLRYRFNGKVIGVWTREDRHRACKSESRSTALRGGAAHGHSKGQNRPHENRCSTSRVMAKQDDSEICSSAGAAKADMYSDLAGRCLRCTHFRNRAVLLRVCCTGVGCMDALSKAYSQTKKKGPDGTVLISDNPIAAPESDTS